MRIKVLLWSLALLCVCPDGIGGREILSYSHGDTSRKEEGSPGSSVTGEWSWLDHTGEMRKIWYIADENGFRAFGDVVPNHEWSQTKEDMPVIGASVVPPLSRGTSDNLKQVSTAPQNAKSRTSSDNSKDLKEVSTTGSQNLPNFRDTNTKLNTNVQPNSHSRVSDINKVKSVQNRKDTRTNSNSVASNTQTGDNVINFIDQGSLQVADGSTPIASVEASPSSNSSTNAKNTTEEASMLAGTSFVLLSHMRLPLPTTFSDRRANKIRPVPVRVTGPPSFPTTGILSAPRAIDVLDNNRKAKTFGTALSPATGLRRVPTPSKVEGMLNFDNFLRPAHIATTNNNANASPSQSTDANYDYYYYDDYYYDEKPAQSSKGRKVKPRTVRSDESIESFEDFDDSEEEAKNSSNND